MKRNLLILLLFLFVAGYNLYGQVTWPTKVVTVAPDAGQNIGTLDAAILANQSAIYELKRGGVYYTNGTLTLPAVPIIIRAEAGTGKRPVIMGGIPSGGFPSGNNIIRVGANIKFQNIYFTGADQIGTVHKNTLRMNAGTWFEFTGCAFDKDNAATIRNESNSCRYLFQYCTFRNEVDYAGVANGRCFDARDAKIKLKLIMKNNSFYNVSQQVIRTSTSQFDSIVFVNNTLFSVMEGLSFGQATVGICNNNIFYNTGLLGGANPRVGQLAIDSIAGDNTARKFDFRNNLFYIEKAYRDVMVKPAGTKRYERFVLNNAAKYFAKNGQLVISDTIKNVAVAFTNPPPLAVGYVKYMWDNSWPGTLPSPTASQKIDVMEDPTQVGDVASPYIFTYPSTSIANNGGLNGDPLGDLHWFGFTSGISDTRPNESTAVKAWFSGNTLNLMLNEINPGAFNIRLYSIDGKKVADKIIYNSQQKTQVEIAGLTKGVYLFIVENKDTKGLRPVASGRVVF